MGEKIRVVSQITLPDMKLDIELNEGTALSKKTQYIHLQNDRFRLALPDHEYIQMAIAIYTSGRKIKEIKHLTYKGLNNGSNI